jgi:AAA+ ATPase superfamily predicted ATPase
MEQQKPKENILIFPLMPYFHLQQNILISKIKTIYKKLLTLLTDLPIQEHLIVKNPLNSSIIVMMLKEKISLMLPLLYQMVIKQKLSPLKEKIIQKP